jgi:hypothetical protein
VVVARVVATILEVRHVEADWEAGGVTRIRDASKQCINFWVQLRVVTPLLAPNSYGDGNPLSVSSIMCGHTGVATTASPNRIFRPSQARRD